jgi:hypothetical protein
MILFLFWEVLFAVPNHLFLSVLSGAIWALYSSVTAKRDIDDFLFETRVSIYLDKTKNEQHQKH